VAFDGRRESRAFAEEVCAVALAAGFKVGLFEPETATPLLAFATRQLDAIAGIMITASHNPPDDNGVKLYLAGGRQIGGPQDQRIEARIVAAPAPEQIARADLAQARASGQLSTLGEAQRDAYVARVRSLLPAGGRTRPIAFAYSALYGVGSAITRRLSMELGPVTLHEVASQAALRADFGGLASPNPEEPSALAELRALTERDRLDLAFAHDPDADRLAVLARAPSGELRTLSGDEVGALIGDFLLRAHAAPHTTLLASTLVSGGLLERIAIAHGACFVRSPTGFKWIAALGRARAEAACRELLFGYEEALGYAFFAMADDKDGIAALAVLCALAQELAAHGKTLSDRLAELAQEHGMFVARQLTVVARGPGGKERLARCLERLRALPPSSVLGEGATLTDHERAEPPFPLLEFAADSAARVCVRPSGTEPKLKVYLHAREMVRDASDVEAARARGEARLSELAERLEPLLAES
jgi:phosphomannomutase